MAEILSFELKQPSHNPVITKIYLEKSLNTQLRPNDFTIGIYLKMTIINASYALDLVEKRLILLAIARSRKSGKGITANDPLEIYASDYAESFNVERQASYMALTSATESLFI